MHLDPAANLVAYLLAAAEIAFAVLSFVSRRISDASALRIIIWTFVTFHASSAVLEIYAYCYSPGIGAAIWANVVARIVIVLFFAYFLRRCTRDSSTRSRVWA